MTGHLEVHFIITSTCIVVWLTGKQCAGRFDPTPTKARHSCFYWQLFLGGSNCASCLRPLKEPKPGFLGRAGGEGAMPGKLLQNMSFIHLQLFFSWKKILWSLWNPTLPPPSFHNNLFSCYLSESDLHFPGCISGRLNEAFSFYTCCERREREEGKKKLT